MMELQSFQHHTEHNKEQTSLHQFYETKELKNSRKLSHLFDVFSDANKSQNIQRNPRQSSSKQIISSFFPMKFFTHEIIKVDSSLMMTLVVFLSIQFYSRVSFIRFFIFNGHKMGLRNSSEGQRNRRKIKLSMNLMRV